MEHDRKACIAYIPAWYIASLQLARKHLPFEKHLPFVIFFGVHTDIIYLCI